MKKLMILACVAMGVAFAANANAVKWQFTNTKVSATAPADAVDFSQGTWNAYLVLTSDWTDQALATLENKAVGGPIVLGVTSPNPATQIATIAAQVTDTDMTKGSYNWTMVISNGEKYLAYTKNADVYDPGDALATPATFMQTNVGPNAAGTSSFGTFSDVPEPTSALLLLVGVAGMALRRRRA